MITRIKNNLTVISSSIVFLMQIYLVLFVSMIHTQAMRQRQEMMDKIDFISFTKHDKIDYFERHEQVVKQINELLIDVQRISDRQHINEANIDVTREVQRKMSDSTTKPVNVPELIPPDTNK
jgi:hypothetical protein